MIRLSLLLLLVFFSFGVSAKKDSLFLKPNILIEYERGPWEGPSGGERKYRKQNNYKRFCNEHYLYTGWSERSNIERNWLIYPEILIASGYSDQLISNKTSSVQRFNRRFYSPGKRQKQNPLANSGGIVLESETRTINGFTYTFESKKLIRYKLNHEKEKITYNRSAWLDTTFADGTYLQISLMTHDGSFDFLAKRIEKLLQIQHIPTSEVDRIQRMHFNRRNLFEALDTIYAHWKVDFINNEKKMLSCTSAESIYPLVMDQMSMESVVALLSDFKYEDLADSIMRIHREFLFNAGNRLLAIQNNYGYSITKEHAYYQMLAHGRAHISDLLNYMNKDSSSSFLDTLDMFQTIREFTAYNLQRYLEQHDQKLFEEEISIRFFSQVQNEVCRQFAIQNLNYHDDKVLYSKMVSESKSRKIFLISFNDRTYTTPILVIFTREKDHSWKSTHRQLDFNPSIDGKSGMYALKSYLVVPAVLQCMVLDSREGKNDVAVYEMDSTNWNIYKQILVVDKPMIDSPFDFGIKDIQEKTQPSDPLSEETKQFYPGQRQYDDEFPAPQPLVNDEAVIHVRKNTLKPEEVLFYQPFVLTDINKNGSPEILAYTLCNGELLQFKCISADEGELRELDQNSIEHWLKQDDQYQNLCQFSRIGNH